MKKYKPLSPEEKEQKDREYEQKVANLFLKGMEENNMPWMKPWTPAMNKLDYNLFSMTKNGKQTDFYKGINGLLCELTRLVELKTDDPRWCTIQQLMTHNKNIKDPKEHLYVKKGEHGLPIKFYSRVYFDKDNNVIKTNNDETPTNAVKYKSVLKTYTIFHASQIYKHTYDEAGNKIKDKEGNYVYKAAFPYKPEVEDENKFKPLIKPEQLIKNSGAVVVYDSIDTCGFDSNQDVIHMVKPEYFKSPADFYDTLLHEHTHWTGHPSRLNREELNKYSENIQMRAREELIAEIGGFLLAKECNIAFKPSENNFAYVKSWMQALKDDPKSIFTACKKAEQAKKYILSFSKENVNKNTNIIEEKQNNSSITKSLGR